MHCRGRGVDGKSMRGAHVILKLAFELGGLRTSGKPPGLERFYYLVDLFLLNCWEIERDEWHLVHDRPELLPCVDYRTLRAEAAVLISWGFTAFKCRCGVYCGTRNARCERMAAVFLRAMNNVSWFSHESRTSASTSGP